MRSTTGDVVLDCDGLQFMDSGAVAVFVSTQHLLQIEGRELRVVNLAAAPRRTLELLGLSDTLGLGNAD
jgi:anti-anti-sigma factor